MGDRTAGLLQPLVDAELAAGRPVRVADEERRVRGDPAEVWLGVGRGRGEVEAAWDLGPLVGWYAVRGGWRLEDATTRCSLDLGRAPVPDVPLAPADPRPRVGYLADQPWVDLDDRAGDELARLADPPPPPAWPGESGWLRRHRLRYVATEDPAVAVLDRLRRLLLDVLPAATADAEPSVVTAALPGWFREVCPPAWTTAAAAVERARIGELGGGAARRAGWAARWSVDEVARHLVASERTWRFHSAAVEDDHLLALAVRTRGLPAPMASLKWLLRVCGARECVPPPQLVARVRG